MKKIFNNSIPKNLISLLCIIFLSYTSYAQCPAGDVLLKNQEDVDNFLATYPTCTAINGNLIIAGGVSNSGCYDCSPPSTRYTGTVVTDLTPLAGITSVTGDFVIYGHEYLTELDGIENISMIGGDLTIAWNFREETIGGAIVNFGLTEAIFSITSVGGDFVMDHNRALEKLKGLENLPSMTGNFVIGSSLELDTLQLTNLSSVGGAFVLANLPSLEYLGNAPWALTTVGTYFNLVNLDSLENTIAFQNLTTVGADFQFYLNEKFQSLSNFTSLTEIGGQLNIADNPNLVSLGGLNINLTKTFEPGFGAGIRFRNNNSLVNLDAQFNTDDIFSSIDIFNNASLSNLDALQGIDSVLYLSISGNASLTNIDDLGDLVFIGASTYIALNTSLENLDGFSNLNGFGPYKGFYGDFHIMDNTNLDDLTGLCPLFATGDLDTTLTQNNNGAVLDATHCAPPVVAPYAQLNRLYNAGTISWYQRRILRKKLKRCHIYSFKLIVNFYRLTGILTQQQADDLIAGAEIQCGITSSSYGAKVGEPTSIFLGQNFPNPTDGVTMIPFTVLATGDVNINLYDATGRLVKVIVDDNMMEGDHQIKVDLHDLPQGTYFYRMEASGRVETLPMVKK